MTAFEILQQIPAAVCLVILVSGFPGLKRSLKRRAVR